MFLALVVSCKPYKKLSPTHKVVLSTLIKLSYPSRGRSPSKFFLNFYALLRQIKPNSAPLSANRQAASKPKPALAPVMIQILPSMFFR